MPDQQTDDDTSAALGSGDHPAVVGDPAASDGISMREPALADGPELWRLARDSGLDINSPYAYTLWSRDFAATSVIARDADGRPRGFVTGFVRPSAPDTYFLWQVGVDPGFRGRRLARRMLDHIGDRIAERGLTYLEATVTPDNTASRALFSSFARDRDCEAVWSPLFEREHFPADESEGHEPEDLVRIGPLGRPDSDRSTAADTTPDTRS
ncbi:diaminobutyrate acetyltransferase [Streptomonospora litoralis]|uniref:L-2,4-diaminobutyric acid acetyltransferase n=1 Tax=Streptomonospora litoralis TaxID=2498135 RepID=A0A4P6PVS4_9ACTN|nr:diaminobutyrate acetyltransferase [Streptomonospora litoralis]QBI52336.1 L-2,4-diaminobutyric acid acetyltransferase [Streptomonospora litoralis]